MNSTLQVGPFFLHARVNIIYHQGVNSDYHFQAQSKEARIETVFRYANVFKRALQLMGSESIDVKPLITDSYSFEDSIKAFEYAANPKPESVKVQIHM